MAIGKWLGPTALLLSVLMCGCKGWAPCFPGIVNYQGDGQYKGSQGPYCYVLDLGEVSLQSNHVYSFRIQGLPSSDYVLEMEVGPVSLPVGTAEHFATNSTVAQTLAKISIQGKGCAFERIGRLGEKPAWWCGIIGIANVNERGQATYRFDYSPGGGHLHLHRGTSYMVTLSLQPRPDVETATARILLRGGEWK